MRHPRLRSRLVLGGSEFVVNPKNTSKVRCAAYQPVARSKQGWAPCGRRAVAGSSLCKMHRDGLAGVMLGCLAHGPAVDEAVPLVEDVAPWNRGPMNGLDGIRKSAD